MVTWLLLALLIACTTTSCIAAYVAVRSMQVSLSSSPAKAQRELAGEVLALSSQLDKVLHQLAKDRMRLHARSLKSSPGAADPEPENAAPPELPIVANGDDKDELRKQLAAKASMLQGRR